MPGAPVRFASLRVAPLTALAAAFLLTALAGCAAPHITYQKLSLPVIEPAKFNLTKLTKTVAVTGFVVKSDAPVDLEVVARRVEDGVAGGITKEGYLSVVERRRLEEAEKELHLSRDGRFHPPAAKEFGMLVAADAVIAGEIVVSVNENTGPFERESAESMAARQAWQNRKNEWDDAEQAKYDAWATRKQEWETAEAEKAFRDPNYQKKPFEEAEPELQPYEEPEPPVVMETWYFVEQTPQVEVSASLVDVETGKVQGTNSNTYTGQKVRDENKDAAGLRRVPVIQLVGGLLDQSAVAITKDVTPHKSTVDRSVAGMSGGPLAARLQTINSRIQEKAFDLAEGALIDFLEKTPEPDEYHLAARAAAYNNLGIVLEAMGRVENALEHYRLAIQHTDRLTNDNGAGRVFARHHQSLKDTEEKRRQALEQSGRGG